MPLNDDILTRPEDYDEYVASLENLPMYHHYIRILTNVILDSFNDHHEASTMHNGDYVLTLTLTAALSAASIQSLEFHYQDPSWIDTMTDEDSRLAKLITGFRAIVQASVPQHQANTSVQASTRIERCINEMVFKISLYALLVLRLGHADKFPSPLGIRLMEQGLFSMTLIDKHQQPMEPGRYRLTL